MVYNPQVAEAGDLVNNLADSLNLRGRCWTSSTERLEDKLDEFDSTLLILVAGGDGTILRAVRVIAPFSIPIVGINLGRVGFMTELSVKEAAERLPEYLNGSLRVEQRMMLSASVTPASAETPRLTIHALNDVVVGRGVAGRLLDISTTVDGVPLTSYRADAIIVSTATGSTGYALSAGGPVLYPEAHMILIQPIAAHTGMRSGVIVPGDSVVRLTTSDSHSPTLSVDGFADVALDAGDQVTIERSPYVAKFLRAHPPSAFYATVTRRLGFADRSKS